MSTSGSPITSVAELLAHALELEIEAEERYRSLADQMEMHNNLNLAHIFRTLAGHEAHHAEEIKQRLEGIGAPSLEPGAAKWRGAESPEAVDFGAVRYNMTPWHALQLALTAERKAFEFFDRIAKAAQDAELKRWATEFAAEEQEHVDHVLRELKKYPEPPAGWDDDPDPPVQQE